MRISIDCGHGIDNTGYGNGYDPGASYFGLNEHDIVYELGRCVRNLLEDAGHDVLLQESGPYWVRDDRAEEWGAEIHTALHCDALDATSTGVSVFVNRSVRPGTAHHDWAETIGRQLASTMGLPFRGVRHKDFGTLGGAVLDCLVEVFFLSNRNDLAAYRKHRGDVCKDLAKLIPTKPGEESDMDDDIRRTGGTCIGADAWRALHSTMHEGGDTSAPERFAHKFYSFKVGSAEIFEWQIDARIGDDLKRTEGLADRDPRMGRWDGAITVVGGHTMMGVASVPDDVPGTPSDIDTDTLVLRSDEIIDAASDIKRIAEGG